MKARYELLSVPLSNLVPGRRDPRKVKSGSDAHQRLVALIRSQGLLQPLVVRRTDGKAKQYEVVAGHRRLRALREIHKDDGNPKVPCILHDVDATEADAMSLAENFAREPMHPLDEAEAFAKLASADGKDARAIAAEFGVKERYVRQRMKLATLVDSVKVAYRQGAIDTATAEAFASVPEDRQAEVWKEVGGAPRHADQVRNVIANAWIDAKHATFDVSLLPELAVSRDLFGDRVLIERQAFMEAQAQSLETRRQEMREQGWSEVVVGRREDVQDRLYAMDQPAREFDDETSRKLDKVARLREKLETAAEQLEDGDDVRIDRLQKRFEALEAKEHEIIAKAPEHFSEETKSVATAFLTLDPGGRVHQDFRIPRQRHSQTPNGNSAGGTDGAATQPKPPTSDDLSDRQLAVTFTHEALAVREAALKNVNVRSRVLALILHEKVRSEALAVHHEPNSTTLCADGEGFASPAITRLREKRAKVDPFAGERYVDDCKAFEHIEKLSTAKLDALIDLLTVDCITAHLRHRTKLVHHLAVQLRVNVRDDWRPDTAWLSSFQKIQLAHLITQLKGPTHAPAPERKKSDLVEILAKLFADAAEGKLEDKKLAERVNAWLPSNLLDSSEEERESKASR
jgi:ParB/RepB/Spo0J family partition protein